MENSIRIFESHQKVPLSRVSLKQIVLSAHQSSFRVSFRLARKIVQFEYYLYHLNNQQKRKYISRIVGIWILLIATAFLRNY